MLIEGGNAVDALVAAQAVLTVVAPDACGLGGDAFVLLEEAGEVTAINGAGAAPLGAERIASSGPLSVMVPGIVDCWTLLAPRMACGLGPALQFAIRLAHNGTRVDPGLAAARDAQKSRLEAGGAGKWPLIKVEPGARLKQPELAQTLEAIAFEGRAGFYGGQVAAEMLKVLSEGGSDMTEADLERPAAMITTPVAVAFADHVVHVQPPASQGALLAMCLAAWEAGDYTSAERAHVGVELTLAVFEYRDEIARGIDLLSEVLEIDRAHASLKDGPRSYLHTAGVCTSDAEGRSAASLVSVFDDFGSGVFLPRSGFVLNNRGGGFTSKGNAFAPGKRPVHTLAPALVTGPSGTCAISTPGADGQVQSLLQVMLDWLASGTSLTDAVAAPRWRSEDGKLLVEKGHPALDDLSRNGHRTVPTEAGDMRFGAITAAGRHGNTPFALADWRRTTWAGVA